MTSLPYGPPRRVYSASAGELAGHFGIPETNVRVITEFMGGGFGAKFGARKEGVICALLARKAGAPVKLMLTRKEEHLATGNRPSAVQQVKLGATKDGKLIAYERSNYGTPGVAGSANIPGAPVPVRDPQLPDRTDERIHQCRPHGRAARTGTPAGGVRHGIHHGRDGRGAGHGPGGPETDERPE